MFKKIDLFVNGEYICSTNQSKTCSEAKYYYIYHEIIKKVIISPKRETETDLEYGTRVHETIEEELKTKKVTAKFSRK